MKYPKKKAKHRKKAKNLGTQRVSAHLMAIFGQTAAIQGYLKKNS